MASSLKERLSASRIRFKKQLSNRNTRIGLALHRGTPLRDLRKSGVVSATQSRQSLRYHKIKAADASFHCGEWGGVRRAKFSDSTITLMSIIIWNFLDLHPLANFYEVLQAIRLQGIDCRRSYLRNLFRQWKFSWKKPVVQQLVSFIPSLLWPTLPTTLLFLLYFFFPFFIKFWFLYSFPHPPPKSISSSSPFPIDNQGHFIPHTLSTSMQLFPHPSSAFSNNHLIYFIPHTLLKLMQPIPHPPSIFPPHISSLIHPHTLPKPMQLFPHPPSLFSPQ